MLKKLDAFLYGKEIGRFKLHANGTIGFTYDELWTGQDISLSLPRSRPQNNARPFLEGLLPENSATLRNWEREYRIPSRDILGLLSVMGHDAPGAIQFTAPGKPLIQNEPSRAIPLSERQLSLLMRSVLREEGTWTAPSGQDMDAPGKFSLAGQQRKTALYRDADGQWCLPQGRFPSTHIVKPQISEQFAFSDVNEAVCLSAMRRLGIRASVETIEMIGGVRASVVERYDRKQTTRGVVQRFHQEDFCQILGCLPSHKYEENGGPSAPVIAQTIRKYAGESDVLEFVSQLAFNVAIAGTDAHAKNFSLIEGKSRCTLAPAYDVASYLYKLDHRDDSTIFKGLRGSLQIGDTYRLAEIGIDEWVRFACDSGLDPDTVLEIVRRVDEGVVDAVADSVREFGEYAAGSPVWDLARLVENFLSIRTSGRSIGVSVSMVTPKSGQVSFQNDRTEPESGMVWVNPYWRKDGVLVRGHWRKPRHS